MTAVRRRGWRVLGALAVIALACRGDAPSPAQAPLVLATERALEARFTGEQLARHRPYRAHAGFAPESVPLAQLAALEHQGDTADLIAALAATGDLARARGLATATDARGDSDRAALALADGDPERALGDAYHALRGEPQLAAAWWNLALAARALDLLRVSRDAFGRVAALGEAGWSDEARARIAALAGPLAIRAGAADFDARGRAMIDGGPAITAGDVERYPAFARIYTLEALRLADGPARRAALAPTIAALDDRSHTQLMAAAAARAGVAPPAVRARFFASYRKLLARTATPAEADHLIDALRAAALDDLRAGAIILAGQAVARLDELTAITAPWHDPWFALAVTRAQIQRQIPPGDLRAVPALTAALADDPGDAFALRAGQLAQDLAQLLDDSGRSQDAEAWSARAVAWFDRAGSELHLENARADLGALHRTLGRAARARAELEEVALALGDGNCHLRRFVSIALADLAFGARDFPAVRATLPPAVPPAGCAEALVLQGLATATDLARLTGDPHDADIARAWIADARSSPAPDRDGAAAVATTRLARGADPHATAALRDWLIAHPATASTDRIDTRNWAFTTLISDAAAHADWPGVLDVAALERPAAAATACRVLASLDDGALSVAVRTPAGAAGDQRTIDPSQLATTPIVPPALADRLARCPAIAVDARPPLHGRGDILPAQLPWWFASDAPARAARPGPALAVVDPRPPDRSLPALPPATPSTTPFDATLRGADATPARVLAALAGAAYAELHVHGVVAAPHDGAAFLALSPEPDGSYALTAAQVRHANLTAAPLIILAACRAATVAPYLRTRWSLPDAFLAAGARAVIAADVAIPDRDAQPIFDELHRRVTAGEPIEAVVAALRSRGAGTPAAWLTHLMLFR